MDQSPAAADAFPSKAPDGGLPLQVVPRADPRPIEPRRGLARRLLRRVWFVPLLLPLVASGGLVGLYFQPPGLQKLMALLDLEPGAGTSSPIAVPARPKTDAAGRPSPQPRTVVGLARLLPEGNVTVIALPFGAGDARIASLEVEEGDRVDRGAVLARLDNGPELQAAADSARAVVASREAGLAQARSTAAAARDEARAALARAEAAAVNAEQDLERVDALLKRGFATKATADQRRAARDQARQDVEKARATLARYDYADLARQPDVAVADRNLDAARADLARAERDLDKAFVRAPIAGTVLTVHVRVGERPGSDGIMNLGNIDRMTAEIEVYQTQIGKVAPGARVELAADALPHPLRGEVTRIGLEVRRQTLVNADPAANTDARVVEVTATLDEASSLVARRFTNLQVIARIAAEPENGS